MENATIISGYSVHLAFAKDSDTLIDNLKRGECVNKAYWFESDDMAKRCQLASNKLTALLAQESDDFFDTLCGLIDSAIEKAKLDKGCLAGENVRVYLTGLGARVDKLDYAAYYDYCDVEDFTFARSLKNLHVRHISQDRLAHRLAHRYGLKYTPPNMNCTSNSSLSAVHLGIQAIGSGGVDLVVVINCSKIKTQDIFFLDSQSMLEGEAMQPFGEGCKSVLFAEGFGVMVLESNRHFKARRGEEGIRLTSYYTHINAGSDRDTAYLSVNLLKAMNKVMAQANVTCDDLCAIIPHGNGSENSDKAEAQAIALLLGERSIPVLAYKGQIGYTATGSGIVDLVIGHHSLKHGELLSPVGTAAIRENVARYVMLNKGIVKHDKKHLLKVGLGVDGSIIGIVMSNNDWQ